MVTRTRGTLLIATRTRRNELAAKAEAERKLNRQLNAISLISAAIVIIGAILGGVSN